MGATVGMHGIMSGRLGEGVLLVSKRRGLRWCGVVYVAFWGLRKFYFSRVWIVVLGCDVLLQCTKIPIYAW